ncbi:MAG: site-specific DNA-methyltransferase [Chloroflexi bacterium]|nr:site-specific DNA-methyltransferase [Chloroflexota bacterium]
MRLLYDHDGVALYHGDATHMDLVGEGSVQLIATSPPFNCGRGYDVHDDRMAWPDYYAMLAAFLVEARRVLWDGGVLALNVPISVRVPEDARHGGERDEPVGVTVWQMVREAGFLRREILHWIKVAADDGIENGALATGTAVGPDNNPYLRPCVEWILLASRGRYHLDNGSGRRGQTELELCKDVWHLRGRNPGWHPAPWAEEIPARLIRLYTLHPDHVVLDPFGGTMITCWAARKAGRRAIGIDKSEAYVRQAAGPLLCT